MTSAYLNPEDINYYETPTRAKSAHDLGRLLLYPFELFFRSANSPDSSSIRRFFKSAHVADLRLIAGIAWLLVALILAIVIFPPATAAGTWGEFSDVGHIKLSNMVKFLDKFGPTLGVLLAVIAWAYQKGSARLGVVDLFACEISTLCRVTTIVDAAKRYVDEYSREQASISGHTALTNAPATQFSSSEEYFPIFDTNSRDLQYLEEEVVINITAFYTYMKAVRDMRRALQMIAQPSAHRKGDSKDAVAHWQEAMRNLIYMLFLALESARKAIHDLVEYEPQQAERKISILISELEAYGFLCGHFPDKDDIRLKRLLMRKRNYALQTSECIELVHQGVANPRTRRHWGPAGLLIDQLRARCDEALTRASDAEAQWA